MRTSLFLLACAGSAAFGAGTVTFEQIQAIFDNNCIRCHGGSHPDDNMNLQTQAYNNLMKKGYVKAGDPAGSTLYKAVTGAGVRRMPDGGPYLPDSLIQRIHDWIQEGAPAPGTSALARGPAAAAPRLDFAQPLRAGASLRWEGAGTMRLSVLTLGGALVRAVPAAGGAWIWDGKDQAGRALPAGTYVLALSGAEGGQAYRALAEIRP